jgi:tripartite-type tricarboxylate transporter receptor subunit TctC
MLRRNGLTGTMVAFKGGPDACTALAQNEIQMVISALPLIIPFKGKIKPIVMLTEQRSPLTPDVSTFREQGLDINELNYWGAFAVPAGTPASIVAQHHRNLAEVVKTPGLASKYMTAGMFAQSSTSEVMAKIIADEVRWMTPIANELNLKAG